MLGVTWGTGQVLLDMLWFFLFLIEIWLMISVFIDVFRRHDMKGWLKAFWVVFVILFPLIGIVLYLIFYGTRCVCTRSRRSSTTMRHSGRRGEVVRAQCRRRPRPACRVQGAGDHQRRRVRTDEGKAHRRRPPGGTASPRGRRRLAVRTPHPLRHGREGPLDEPPNTLDPTKRVEIPAHHGNADLTVDPLITVTYCAHGCLVPVTIGVDVAHDVPKARSARCEPSANWASAVADP